MEALDGIDANLRFHHLLFDPNGEPKFCDLAEALADHMVDYCLSVKRRNNPITTKDHARLNRKARELLRKWGTSGEAGELLLYFLIEAILQAPQMVAKMSLKTNPNVEVHGSDGIHMKWDEKDQLLDIYFGEAKLEQTVYSALNGMIDSLVKFHDNGMRSNEIELVTNHYKHADGATKKAVMRLINRQLPGGDCRINHACLIGYDWDVYKELKSVKTTEITTKFLESYSKDIPRLKGLLTRRFTDFPYPRLRFQIFFLPFPTVQEFRDAFYKAVFGVDISR